MTMREIVPSWSLVSAAEQDPIDTSSIDSSMARTLFKEYVEAKKTNGEKVNMTYGDLVKKLAAQIPKLEARLGGPVRFKVAFIDGKVRLRARRVEGASPSVAAPIPKPPAAKTPPPLKAKAVPPPLAKASEDSSGAVLEGRDATEESPAEESPAEDPPTEDPPTEDELHVGLTGHFATVEAAAAIEDLERKRRSETKHPELSDRWHTLEQPQAQGGMGRIIAIAAAIAVILGAAVMTADRWTGALASLFAQPEEPEESPPERTKPEGEEANEDDEPAHDPEPEYDPEAGVRSLEVQTRSSSRNTDDKTDATRTKRSDKPASKTTDADSGGEPTKPAEAGPKQDPIPEGAGNEEDQFLPVGESPKSPASKGPDAVPPKQAAAEPDKTPPAKTPG